MASRKKTKEITLAQAFGITVKKYREKTGMTQDQLAFTAKIDRSYTSQIERGIKNVTLPFVWQLAEALKVRPSELIQATERHWRQANK